MIDRDHDLSIVRQAKVLKLARSTVYYEPRPVSAEDLALMRRLDELHLDYPFAGARMLRSLLRREAFGALQRFGRQLNRLRDDLVVNEEVQCLPRDCRCAGSRKSFG
ncbi:hypothetical protein ABIF50_010467 [Bradyrhizobium diazoefficiens]